MPDISKIQLPGSNTIYDIKDAVAREAIAGGVSFVIAWDGISTPTVANIPEGIKVVYNNTVYTGTLSAETTGSGTHAQAGAFYLVKTHSVEYILLVEEPTDWSTKWTDYYEIVGGVYTQLSGASAPTWEADTYYRIAHDTYDEYVPVGETGSKTWEKLGDTSVDLSDVVTGVSLNKQTDTVIGTDSTFSVTQPSITITEGDSGVTFVRGGTTKYMAATATGGAVTPTVTNIKATATGGATSWNSKDQVTAVTGYESPSTDTFVKSVSAETNKKMVTTSIPNVTNAGSASTWSFAMGSGNNSETLIISGGNSVAPTLGTAITAATGATAVDGTGDAVVTGVTIGSSASAITSLGTPSTDSVIGADATFSNTQPTVSLATDATAGAGVIEVATGISSVTPPTVSLTAESATAQGRAEFTQSLDTSKKIAGSASGAAVAWNDKDSVSVLKDTTSINVTKGE